MKNARFSYLIAMLIMVLLAGLCFASGTPKKISYQGKVTDPSGNPVTDGSYSCTFVLYDHPSLGTSRWSEIAIVATTGGLYSHLLGSNALIPDSLFAAYDSLYLQVYFSGQTIWPRTPIVSTGYAMRVNSVDGAKGGKIDGATVWMDTTVGKVFGVMRSDASGDGAGFLELYADGSVGSGFFVDGNYNSTGQPQVGVYGTDRSVVFNTSIAGSSSVRLPADAIEASEISNEAGVGSCVNTTFDLSTSIVNICGRTMFAPTDGYVLVTGVANLCIVHTNGTMSQAAFGVSDNISAYVGSSLITIAVPSSAPSGSYYYPMVSHALFPISQGSHAYFFLASKSGASIAQAFHVNFTEVFIPTAYTTVSTPIPPVGEELPKALLDTLAERSEAEAFHKKQVADELARMKADIELLKKQLEEKRDKSPVD